MIEPIYVHDAGKLSVFCIGNALSTSEPEILVETASQLTDELEINASRTVVQQFPAKKVRRMIWVHHKAWTEDDEKVILNKVSADAVRISSRNMAVVFNSYGPYLVLWSVEMGHSLVLNCGLEQLRGVSEHEREDSVVRNALSEIMGIWLPSEVRGLITMGTRMNHSSADVQPRKTHRHDRSVLLKSKPHYESETSDPVELTLRQLEEFTIPRKNIAHDGIDTLSHERCASAGRPGNNMIIVHYRS